MIDVKIQLLTNKLSANLILLHRPYWHFLFYVFCISDSETMGYSIAGMGLSVDSRDRCRFIDIDILKNEKEVFVLLCKWPGFVGDLFMEPVNNSSKSMHNCYAMVRLSSHLNSPSVRFGI